MRRRRRLLLRHPHVGGGLAGGVGGGRLLAEHQLHQLLLLAAHLRGHLVQVQVVAQVLHLQLHQLGAVKQRGAQALARQAEPWLQLQLRGAAAAEALLAVHAHMLSQGRRKTHSQLLNHERGILKKWTQMSDSLIELVSVNGNVAVAGTSRGGETHNQLPP